MLARKIWILLIASFLTGCATKKTVVVVPEYTIVTQDSQDNTAVLREEFNTIIGNKVYFNVDSSVLSSEARNRLEKQARWLLAHPMIIVTIEGHCDERGLSERNNELGLKRAEAVRAHLITHGVDQSRLVTVSYGKDRPEATDHDPGAWELNRRAVSIISKGL